MESLPTNSLVAPAVYQDWGRPIWDPSPFGFETACAAYHLQVVAELPGAFPLAASMAMPPEMLQMLDALGKTIAEAIAEPR